MNVTLAALFMKDNVHEIIGLIKISSADLFSKETPTYS